VAQAQHDLTQVGHGDPVAAADIHPAQQGDMVGMPSFGIGSTGWHRSGTQMG
jgi:hypothetical protein